MTSSPIVTYRDTPRDNTDLVTQVGEGLKTIQQCEAATPVDTDYIELEQAGLAEARASLSQVAASCPQLSEAI